MHLYWLFVEYFSSFLSVFRFNYVLPSFVRFFGLLHSFFLFDPYLLPVIIQSILKKKSIKSDSDFPNPNFKTLSYKSYHGALSLIAFFCS